MFELITPASYWVLTILWLVILWLYLSKLRQSQAVGGTVATLLFILAIDAFRTVFESAYFGLYFNSLFGLLPKGIYEVLSQPALLIIPKILNVVAGLLVLFLLIRRWVPREIREREEWIQSLQEAKLVAEKKKKEAEQQFLKFEAIFNGMSDAIIFADTDRRIISVNRGVEKTFGYTTGDLAGKTASVLYESDEEYERQGRIRFNVSAEEKADPYEVNYRRKDGQTFVGETLGTVIYGAKGEVLGFIGVIRDVTERKQAEEKLLEAKEEAENANRTKSEFLASMSHELRTPLNAVLGFAQFLQFDPKHPLSPTQNAHVESILEGGKHLLELVNEILDLARIEADQLNLSLEEVNANEVIADCVALTSPLGKPRGIEIIDKFSSGPSALLRTDQLRLKQVLLNLLSNAVKYNKDGGMVIVDGRETENGFLHLSVTDTGIGIAEVDYSGIFQMFHRLGADPMVAREGTGIGLTVTKLLVERMAGRIGCESEQDVGSTFWIELPLASNEEVLIWTDSLRVGVDAIDKDHQVIVSLLNRVTHQSVEDAELDDMIEELIDYTRHHFRREEVIMEVCGYPDLEKHRGHHRDLAAQVNDLASAWREEHDPETLRHLRKFLREWWIGHIVKVDAEIAQHGKGKEQEIRKALEDLG